MLDSSVIGEVRRLLAAGQLSQRAIARRLGVSRGTVNAVALGRRKDRSSPERDELPPAFTDGPPERCPGCGGLVRMPCLACRIESMRQAGLLDGSALPPPMDDEAEAPFLPCGADETAENPFLPCGADKKAAPLLLPCEADDEAAWWGCVAGRVA